MTNFVKSARYDMSIRKNIFVIKSHLKIDLKYPEIIYFQGFCENLKNNKGITVLTGICNKNYVNVTDKMACLKLLIKAKADPTIKDNNGKTAINWAIETGMPDDFISLLLDYQSTYIGNEDDASWKFIHIDGVKYYLTKAVEIQKSEN